MRLLFHTDLLVDAVVHRREPWFALCQRDDVEGWVLTPALPDAYRQIAESLGDKPARDALGEALTHLSLLPVSGIDLIDALAHSGAGFVEGLAAQGLKELKLDAVVTLTPESFAATGIPAWTLQDALDRLNAPKEAPTRVPILDIPGSYHEWLNEAEHAMMQVTRSGHFILGQKVVDLEELSATYCQTRFALGVSSGTDALLLALMADGIGHGDEVITSTFTFFATAGVISRLGAKPVFVDIEPDTYNLDPDRIEPAITSRTRAIIPVHLYGQCADMEPILEIARRHNLLVIEDACQAIGAEYKGERAGSVGDIGCFSFFPTKNLGGFGDGGLITTQSEALFESLKILRVHGMHPKYVHKQIGGNFRLDALQAAVVAAKLPFLEGWTERRRDNAQRYHGLFDQHGLTQTLGLPAEVHHRHVYNQYVIRVRDGKRDALRDFLTERGVITEIYYPIPLHQQECFQDLGYTTGAMPQAEQAAREVLALPISFELTLEQQERVVSTIRDFYS